MQSLIIFPAAFKKLPWIPDVEVYEDLMLCVVIIRWSRH